MDSRNETIAAAFDRLFRTYQQSDRGEPEAVVRERMERAKVYFEAVEPYQTGDIERAVENFITGNAPGVNPAFAPPAPQVASECRRVMNLRLDHERRSRPVLPPPPEEPISDEERERGKAAFARLKADLDAKLEPVHSERATASKERGERETRWLRDRGDLVDVPGTSVPVSRSLMRQYSVGDDDGDRDVA